MFEMSNPSSRLYSVQALRAIAALLVVIYHATEATLRNVRSGGEYSAALILDIAWLGNVGVDIFFVISGFIMVYAHFDHFGKSGSPIRFLVKRLIRIVPNYWLLTIFAGIIIFFAPHFSQHGREAEIPWIFASLLFIPWTSAAGIPVPIIGLGWTLNFEMYFYVIFSIALIFKRRSAIRGLTLFFIMSIAFGYVFDYKNTFLSQATHWLLAEFLLGIFLGLAFKNGKSISNKLGVVLITVSCVLMALALMFKADGTLLPILRLALFGGSAACLVACLTLTPLSHKLHFPRLILLLGNASYSLYLTHVFTLPATLFGFQYLPFYLSGWIIIVLLVIISIIVGVIFYTLIEKPIQQFIQVYLSLRTKKIAI